MRFLKKSLFWQIFLSFMIVIIAGLYLAEQSNRYIFIHALTKKPEEAIYELVSFKESIEARLFFDEKASAIELLEKNPNMAKQIYIYDLFYNEILDRYSKSAESKQYFTRDLAHFFQERNINLQSQVVSLDGEIYYIELHPLIFDKPLLSPSVLGTTLRFLLLTFSCGIACYLITKRLTKRIKLLQKTINDLEQEIFQPKHNNKQYTQDELGELDKAIDNMACSLYHGRRAKKRLLSDISHELRSPLSRIQVALELARDNPTYITKQLDRIQKENNRMNELIEEIITIQKASLIEGKKNKIELISLLNEIISDASYEYQATNKLIELSNKTNSLTIWGDESLISRALENIIRNALNHTKENTKVQVEAYKKESTIQVVVRDYGRGIDESNIDKAFTPFFRGDLSRSRETGGYGLGLAIAKSVIDAHNGYINISNHQSPSGLIVTIELPINKA